LKNVEMTVTGSILTITVNLDQDHGPSASGKTTLIATTAGNKAVPGREEVKIGLNVYKKRR